MPYLRLGAVVLPLVLVMLVGCAQSDGFRATREWDVGTLRFPTANFDMTDTTISINENEREIRLTSKALNRSWRYTGSYTRVGNTISAGDLPERREGDDDVMRLEFEIDRNTISGHAWNTFWDGNLERFVTARATINGTEKSSPTFSPYDLEAEQADEKRLLAD